VEHPTIIQIMSHMGFPGKWLAWIQAILSSGSSAILLNGVPENFFQMQEESPSRGSTLPSSVRFGS
jgi:hypothetical protein